MRLEIALDIFTSITRHGFAEGPEIELDRSQGYLFLNKVSLFEGKLSGLYPAVPYPIGSISCEFC